MPYYHQNREAVVSQGMEGCDRYVCPETPEVRSVRSARWPRYRRSGRRCAVCYPV